MKFKFMRGSSKKNSLSDVKQSFKQTGYIDWHLPTYNQVNEDDGDLIVQTAPPQLKRPPLYIVVLMNDDYTPMEFVIEVLEQYFAMTLDQATEVMLTVHYEGKGIAGTYPRDIAETKANQVNHYARSKGYPLLCQIEPKE